VHGEKAGRSEDCLLPEARSSRAAFVVMAAKSQRESGKSTESRKGGEPMTPEKELAVDLSMAALSTLITEYMDPRPAEEREAFARDVQAAGQIKLAQTMGAGVMTIQCTCIVDGIARDYFFDADRRPKWDQWLAELVMRYQ
jgi:hypothetical protein